MPLVDIATVVGRAAWVRSKAGLADAGPPYSTHALVEAAFPGLSIAGADLPRGVVEMVERGKDGRRALWYARGAPHANQRVGIAHGLHHFMSDLRRKRDHGMRECNTAKRDLERAGALPIDAVEVACDLFAGELLVPFAVLDGVAPMKLFPERGDDPRWRDQVDALASLFNVPAGFMRWRLWDLMHLRRTNFYVA